MHKNPIFYVVTATLLLLTTCQPAAATLQPSPTATSTTPATEPPTPTVTETAAPTAPPPPTPTPVPSSWKTYKSSELKLTFRYPTDWQQESEGRVSWTDGFVDITTMEYPNSLFDSMKTLCVLDANFDHPAAYGKDALISDRNGWDPIQQAWQGEGCMVTPSDATDASLEAVVYARLPDPALKDRLVVLRMDANHAPAILSTLHFLEMPANPTAATCNALQQTEAQVTLDNRDLRITQYPVADASCDLKSTIYAFSDPGNGASLEAALADSMTEGRRQQAALDNQALEPFGYRLVENSGTTPNFNLYQNETLIVGGIQRLGPVSVNAAGDNFIFWVQDDISNGPPVEVSNGGVRTLTAWDQGSNTAWAGNDLMGYEYSQARLFVSGAPRQIKLTKNGVVEHTYAISQAGAAGYPVVSFGAWNGHWLLEMDNVVIQDGEALNRTLGYAELFNWSLVREKPFFFFQKNGSYGINYAGKELPVTFDDILHAQLCCDFGVYNIKVTPLDAWFYALRGHTWYHVHLEVK